MTREQLRTLLANALDKATGHSFVLSQVGLSVPLVRALAAVVRADDGTLLDKVLADLPRREANP